MRYLALLITLAIPLAAQDAGRRSYERRCAACHGGDGNGGERAPGVVTKLPARSDADLAALIRQGLPGAGMPGANVPDGEMRDLVSFLRGLRPRRFAPPKRLSVRTTDGQTLEGTVINENPTAVQLRTADQRIHLLRRHGDRYRKVTSEADWPTYHGQLSGNRYSPLDQINPRNVKKLAPRWIFPLRGAALLRVTPVVVDGIMYVTGPNETHALDAGTGQLLWNYTRPRTKGVVGDAGSGVNRGVAIAGDRLFVVTDHAHLLALNRFTGALLWDTEMADYRQNYGATAAPLAVGNLVISGHSGGDEGVRGFLAAFDQATGKEVWRFWTVPKRGEPGSETWQGSAIDHGCAATWLTGTYDAALDTVYWPTGNPCPDYNGDDRKGDNLWSDSILALDPKTGRLKWHFQYTPHDLWDWDAQQPPVLIDTEYRGRQRKLLLHANRNGFFYVLDRATGEFLSGTPFVKKLTWAREIDSNGRPVLNPDQTPNTEGATVCPAVEGATNWFSTAYHPGTGYYYVQTLEKCNIFTKRPGQWEPGKSYYDGSARQVPGEPGQKILRAIDVQTGKIAWELPQNGPANTWGGVLATAGGLVFYGDDSGTLSAADARTGEPLWHLPFNHLWKASPMTYTVDGVQYVAVASGPNIVALALVD
ncbi:MAG: PQQ-dependent dehydrogenase, methanol/ethanol family [Bryobacterales bacterium]|nr:PQQ-dependent dehydrogenase, methanol/ethanol family [Bryobacterales bacterium]